MNLLHRPLLDLSSLFHSWFRKRVARGPGEGSVHATREVPVERTRAEQEMQEQVDALQKQLAEERKTAERQREECESATAENDQLKARLTQLDCLPRQVKELQEKLEQERQAATKGWELYEGASADAQQLREHLARLEDDAKHSGLRVSELERAHAVAERERRSSLELLETRTTELREAELYLARGDEVTESEVMHLVDVLNGQIGRTAAAVAHAPQFVFQHQRDPAVVDKAVRRIEHYGWLGPGLLAALRAADPSRNTGTAWLQTALQAGLAMYARWLAMSWELGVVDPRGLLEGVYLHIREQEPQSVAGRWRSLCRRYVKALLETGEVQTQRLFKTLSGIVADVLVIAGATGTWESVSEAVGQAFETDLHQLVNLALQFQWTVGECIVIRDYAVFTEDPDAVFNPARMEEEKGVERTRVGSIRKGTVMCTSQLGLMAETKVGDGKSSPGEIRSTIIMKPKVVLRNALLTGRS